MLPISHLLLLPLFTQSPTISVVINETPVEFRNGQPMLDNSRVLVPLRGVFEKLGATVKWQAQTKAVVAKFWTTEVDLPIGQPVATVNGQDVHLDVPATLVNGSTMVPLRFVSEAMGAFVTWRAADQTVVVVSVNCPHEHSWD